MNVLFFGLYRAALQSVALEFYEAYLKLLLLHCICSYK